MAERFMTINKGRWDVSVESVQFAEMVRQAAAEQRERREFAQVFCRSCQKITTHVLSLRDKRGRVYTCYECGKWFEVR